MGAIALINKETIRIIRENKRVSFEYIFKKTKFSKDKIESWESQDSTARPTFKQAQDLSRCYEVPFAGLFMRSEDIKLKRLPKLKNMRVLFGTSSTDESALNLAVFKLINIRDFLISTKNEIHETISPFNFNIESDDPIIWAYSIRKYFNIEEEKQYECTSKRKFYLYIRNQIEKYDILIQSFKKVDIESIRALSIYFKNIPIIGINDEDRYPAKTFSIIHELVHLIKRTSAYCNDFYNSFSAKQEEVFCNAVAGELLVPKKYLNTILGTNEKESIDEDVIKLLEKKFSVSKEVIIRRLYDLGKINEQEYHRRAQIYREEIIIQKEKQKSKDEKSFSRNIITQTIDRFSTNVFYVLNKGLSEGIFDKYDFARYLDINFYHVDKLLFEVSKWNK